MKLRRILVMIMMLTLLSTGVIAEKKEIQVDIDGVLLKTDVAPTTIKGRTLVPVRAIFETMGAKVTWDEKTQTATGIKGSSKIKLQIGNTKATVNGKTVVLDVAAVKIKNRTLVPARFIAESLGAEVDWDGRNQTVVILSKLSSETNAKHFTFDKKRGEITAFSENGPNQVMIPKSIDGVAVTSIGELAFAYKKLIRVIIPNTVTSIGVDAFTGNSLRSVTIPNKVSTISEGSFSRNKLSKVTIPSSVKIISDYAFWYNDFNEITVPATVTSIGDYAFADSGLTKATILNKITKIGHMSFGEAAKVIKK